MTERDQARPDMRQFRRANTPGDPRPGLGHSGTRNVPLIPESVLDECWRYGLGQVTIQDVSEEALVALVQLGHA